MKKNILVAPLHYVIGQGQLGSEYAWAYHFKKNAESEDKFNFKFVTGDRANNKNTNLITLNTFDASTINLSFIPILRFYLKVILSILRLSSKTDIIHHFLPFNIDKSFSIGAFLNKKLVVGPIQNSLVYKDYDLDPANSGKLGKKSEGFISKLSLLLFQIVTPVAHFLNDMTLKKSNHLVAINNTAKDILIKRGYDANKISVISPGIYTSQIEYKEKSFNKEKMKAVVASYLLDRKKIDLTIKAIHSLVHNHNYKNLSLDIVGEGPQYENLVNLTKKLDVQEYVNFLGRKTHPEVMESYANYDFYINMSMAESFAQTCLESMASGLIVISSKVGGYEDAIIEGKNGFLIDRDPEALVEKLLYALNNKTQLESISKNARESIENNYDWEKVIWPKYREIYDKLTK